MELAETDLHYLHLKPGQALPAIHEPMPSRIVVVIEAEVSDDWQTAVTDWIVAYGCRYLMAWGLNCELWHYRVDWSVLRAWDYDIPDDRFVMTTWHNDQPLEEALFYCEFCARFSYDDVDLPYAMILHIAESADEPRMRKGYADMLAENS